MMTVIRACAWTHLEDERRARKSLVCIHEQLPGRRDVLSVSHCTAPHGCAAPLDAAWAGGPAACDVALPRPAAGRPGNEHGANSGRASGEATHFANYGITK
jgi:hypothetical protein